MKKLLTFAVVLTTLAWTMGVGSFVPMAAAATLTAGDLIKASGKAVYYYDGTVRHPFPSQSVYMSWYINFTGVKTITDDELAAIDLASGNTSNIVVRPGTNLVKINTVPKVYAVEPNGSLVWVTSEAAAKTLYGTNWAKKVIDISDAFWGNYAVSSKSLDGTAYPAGQLVKYAASTDVYYVNADGTKSKVTDSAFTANGWNMANVVTAPTTVTMTAGADVTAKVASYANATQGAISGGTVTTTTGNVSVSLNANTPAANYVSKGAQNAVYAKFDFTANGDAKVTQIILQRKGLGLDADITTVRLYDGATQVGTDQSLNTTTHKVTFKNLSWAIASGATKTLTVKADTYVSATGTNDYFEVVSVTAGGTVSGLPVAGNAMQYSALTVGELNVALVAGTNAVISGAKDQELGCWNFNTGSTEGFYISSIKLTNIGSAASTDALNFSLLVGSTSIPSATVSSMASDNTVTFNMTTPYFIDKSKTKKICVHGDIADGITVAKTLIFQVADTKDVVATGDSSGSEVLIETASSTFSAQTSATNNIGQGSATLAQNSGYAPTTGTTILPGSPNYTMAAYKLTAGSTEGVKLTKLVVVLAGTGVANTDFSNWSLYKIVDGAEVLVPVTGSVSGLNITFEDTTDGLVDVPKSENKTLIVKADASSSLAGTESGIHIYVGANATTNTLARIKGLESGDYITSGVTLSGVATGNAQTFTGATKGDLVVSKASSSPAADTIAKGTTKVHFTDINLYATGEAAEVTDLILTAYEDAGSESDVVDSGELTNVYITDQDGHQLGSTVANPSSGVSTFSFSYVVPKDSNKLIKVYADIPSGSTAATIDIGLKTANTDITSTGVYSSLELAESGTVIGSTITVGGPTLTAAMSTSPVTSSYVVGATEVTIGRLLLTAGTSENLKITSIKLSADDAATLNTTSAANSDITQLKLVDDNAPTTQYGLTYNFTDGTPDVATFSGISNLTVTKGQTKTLRIVGNMSAGSGTFYLGVYDPTVDITGSGVSSGAALAAADINGEATTTIVSTGATITSVGTLAITKAADMPAATQLVSGSTGNELAKYKMTASYENINITVLPLYYTGTVADISNIKLYLNGSQVGDVNGYSLSAKLKTINFNAGEFVVTKDVANVLTIKADLNPKAQVTTSVSSVYIGIADSAYTAVTGANADSEWEAAGSYDITAKGASSGTAITKSLIHSVGTGTGNVYRSNAFTVHKGILTVAKNSASPSGVSSAGAGRDVLVFDLTATGDDILLDEIEFVPSTTCTLSGEGSATLKNYPGKTITYGTVTYAAMSSAAPFTTTVPFSIGDGNTTTNSAVWTIQPSIAAGTTSSFVLAGDTTGCVNPKTVQITIGGSGVSKTTSGVDYEDSSTTAVDQTTTKYLPVYGGTLSY